MAHLFFGAPFNPHTKMICFSGKQGSGKSYLMTRFMYALHHCDEAPTNILVSNWKTPMNDFYIRSPDEFWIFLRAVRNYRESHKWKLNCTIHFFMDEVGSLFNSREFKNVGGEEIGFLTQLRKIGVFLYYGVQHPAFVDISFRRITEEVWICSPWMAVGKKDMSGRRQPWGFKVDVRQFDPNNTKTEELITVREEVFTAKQKFFELYMTSECIEGNFNISTPEERLAYQLNFEEQLESILASRKPTLTQKIFSNIYIPNPFYSF